MRKISLGLLIILCGAMLPRASSACSCVKYTDEEKYRRAETVLVGTVLETRYIKSKSRNPFEDFVEAKVEVTEVIKGSPPKSIVVRDQVPETGMCSSFLLSGTEYVFFVLPGGEVNMCSGTRPFRATIHDRKEHLEKLYELRARATK